MLLPTLPNLFCSSGENLLEAVMGMVRDRRNWVSVSGAATPVDGLDGTRAGLPILRRLCFASYLCLAVLPACGSQSSAKHAASAGEASFADYGDAPEDGPTGYSEGGGKGQFPTSFRADGARCLGGDKAWLGRRPSLEQDALDSQDPDGSSNLEAGDKDDGVLGFTLELGADAQAKLRLGVAKADTFKGRLWLNILADLNQDGTWGGLAKGGEPEWVVQNHAVLVEPGEEVELWSPPFEFSNGKRVPTEVWLRVALTSERVRGEWTGQGEFRAGEIEDHLVTLETSRGIPLVSCRDSEAVGTAWSYAGRGYAEVSCRVENASREFDMVFNYSLSAERAADAPFCTPGSVKSSEQALFSAEGVRLEAAQAVSVNCLFPRMSKKRQEWTLSVVTEAGSDKGFRASEQGFRITAPARATTAFELTRGECEATCRSDAFCPVGLECRRGCCTPQWAECREYADPEACGRCCAVTAGKNAHECVQTECVR